MGNIDRRIFHVRQDERKLYTGVPVFRRFTLPRMLQIKRSVLGMVSVGKEENAPVLKSAPAQIGQEILPTKDIHHT